MVMLHHRAPRHRIVITASRDSSAKTLVWPRFPLRISVDLNFEVAFHEEIRMGMKIEIGWTITIVLVAPAMEQTEAMPTLLNVQTAVAGSLAPRPRGNIVGVAGSLAT